MPIIHSYVCSYKFLYVLITVHSLDGETERKRERGRDRKDLKSVFFGLNKDDSK